MRGVLRKLLGRAAVLGTRRRHGRQLAAFSAALVQGRHGHGQIKQRLFDALLAQVTGGGTRRRRFCRDGAEQGTMLLLPAVETAVLFGQTVAVQRLLRIRRRHLTVVIITALRQFKIVRRRIGDLRKYMGVVVVATACRR